MSWLDNRKQDVEAAIIGGLIGWEAHKQDMEELEWATVEAIADEHDIDLTGLRSFILDRPISNVRVTRGKIAILLGAFFRSCLWSLAKETMLIRQPAQ